VSAVLTVLICDKRHLLMQPILVLVNVANKHIADDNENSCSVIWYIAVDIC